MAAGVRRLTRLEEVEAAVGAMAASLRTQFHLKEEELTIECRLNEDEDAELQVKLSGMGIAYDDTEFDDALIGLRDEYIEVLSGQRWLASVGERVVLSEMPEDVLAARMRKKVKW
jgi:hypothetical protein